MRGRQTGGKEINQTALFCLLTIHATLDKPLQCNFILVKENFLLRD